MAGEQLADHPLVSPDDATVVARVVRRRTSWWESPDSPTPELPSASGERTGDLSEFLSASAAVASGGDVHAALDAVLLGALDLLGATGATVARLEADTLITVSAAGAAPRVGTRTSVGDGPGGRAAADRRVVIGTQVDGAHVVAVPLVDDDDLLGVLTVATAPSSVPTVYDVRAARLFGASAATALRKAVVAEHEAAGRLGRDGGIDALTGLATRSAFAILVEDAFARARATRRMTAIVTVDLDGFAEVNERFGYAAGDEVLTLVAGRMLRCVRGRDHVARIGGDEFAVLLPDLPARYIAGVVARRIVHSLAQPFSIGDQRFTTSASIGVAVTAADDNVTSWETAVGRAELARSEAKRTSRGGYRVVDSRADVDRRRSSDIISELRDGVTRGEFVTHYQPVVALDDGRLVGVEALVRWNHPRRGLLSPGAFVPAAVESGVIDEIGGIVLHTACEQFAAWRAQFRDHAPAWVSVNVAARQLEDPKFADDVLTVLRITDLAGECLLLELTEDTFVDHESGIVDTLQRLRETGVRVALDDFGARYSALGYLLRLPVDTLKMDATFVAGLSEPGGPANAAPIVVGSLLDLAGRLGLETIAEGVETDAQAGALLALGCRTAQGYRFATPLTAEDLAAVLARGARPMRGLIPGQRNESAS